VAEKRPEQVIGGCLARVFTIVGFAILVGTLINAFRTFNRDGFGFELTGAFIPGLILLIMGAAIRRRVGNMERPDKQIPAPRPLNTDRKDEPAKTPIPRVGSAEPRKRPTPPPAEFDVPELPTIEPVHDPGELPAVEDLTMDDFKATAPKSSDEMIKEARRRFNKKDS
jgi:hypothetical protein